MSKLSAIYASLDAHQYNRAIKQAAALPDSNTLGKALLAHAYAKTRQRYNALSTLRKILPWASQIQYEVEHSLQGYQERQKPKPVVEAPKKGKKGKKGKAKPLAKPVEEDQPAWDLVDPFTNPPGEPQDVLPPAEQAIVDTVRKCLR